MHASHRLIKRNSSRCNIKHKSVPRLTSYHALVRQMNFSAGDKAALTSPCTALLKVASISPKHAFVHYFKQFVTNFSGSLRNHVHYRYKFLGFTDRRKCKLKAHQVKEGIMGNVYVATKLRQLPLPLGWISEPLQSTSDRQDPLLQCLIIISFSSSPWSLTFWVPLPVHVSVTALLHPENEWHSSQLLLLTTSQHRAATFYSKCIAKNRKRTVLKEHHSKYHVNMEGQSSDAACNQ